jgi:CheY-like chemotaxis protein
MTKNPTLNAVDAAEEGLARSHPSSSPALRAQAAFVRTLADEVERHHPADRQIAAVRGQLGEELERLSTLIGRHASAPSATPATSPLSVLVVDDDLGARVATATAVRSFGHDCETAETGEEALRIHGSRAVDIVIADWHMPGMNGLDLCRALKAEARPPYVILVTADRTKVDAVQRIDGRPDDFLAKPLDLDDLEARLQSATRLVRSLQGLDTAATSSRAREP